MELNRTSTAVLAVHGQGDVVGADGGFAEATYVLVRPKGHIAWRANALDTDTDTGGGGAILDVLRGAVQAQSPMAAARPTA